MKPFKKISEVQSFKIISIVKSYFERWNEAEKKYEKSDAWQEGFSPKWLIDCGEYYLPLSKDQVSQCLMSSFRGGQSDIIGKSYSVKSNGKTGKEIRYWINQLREQHTEQEQPKMDTTIEKEEMTQEQIDAIPF